MIPIFLGSIQIRRVETRGDAISDLKTLDAGADFDYLAGCIGAGDNLVFDWEWVLALSDGQVAVVERDGADLKQDFVAFDCRNGFGALFDVLVRALGLKTKYFIG